MTNTRPNVNPAARYSVTEACAILGIHRNTLNRYLARGIIVYRIRKATGRKVIAGAEIIRLWNATI